MDRENKHPAFSPEDVDGRHVRTREEVQLLEASRERAARLTYLENRLGSLAVPETGLIDPAKNAALRQRLGPQPEH